MITVLSVPYILSGSVHRNYVQMDFSDWHGVKMVAKREAQTVPSARMGLQKLAGWLPGRRTVFL